MNNPSGYTLFAGDQCLLLSAVTTFTPLFPMKGKFVQIPSLIFSRSVLTALTTRTNGHFLSRRVCTVRMWIRDSWVLKESRKRWGHLVVTRRLYLWIGALSLKACFLKVSPIFWLFFIQERASLCRFGYLGTHCVNSPGCPGTRFVDQADLKLSKFCLPLPSLCWD